jgi:hypothetical protein
MMEAAAGSSDTSENFLPDYMAYAYNLNFNLCALTPLKVGGVIRAVTQIQRPLYIQ